MITVALGAFLYKAGPHFLFQDAVQYVFQHYTKEFPTRVSSKLRALLEEVLEDAQLTEDQVARANVFIGSPSDAWAWGSVGGTFLVMLPDYLMYDSPKDIDVRTLRFGKKSADDEAVPDQIAMSRADDEDAVKLAENFILSENAKKFAVAREVERAKTAYPYLNAIFMPMNVASAYLAALVFNRKFKLHFLHPVFRMANYVLQASFWGLLTLSEQDMLNRKTDVKCDANAARYGPSYAAGGVEFYEKQIQRNLALRTLMPAKKGEAFINRKGEYYRGLVRNKYVPFATRKANCEAIFNQT